MTIRISMRDEEAQVVIAALRYYRDTYLDDEEEDRSDENAAETLYWRSLGQRVLIRLHRSLRRQGLEIPIE